MKILRLATAAAVGAFLAVLAPLPAQAYEGVDVYVTDRTVVGGNSVSITAHVAPPGITCTTFTLTYDGVTKTATNTNSITRTFDTDEVDEETDTTAFATCNFDDGQLSSASLGGGGLGSLGTLVAAPQESSGTGTITLLPDGDGDGDSDGDEGDDDGDDNGGGDGDDNGGLPDTGGERLTWLLIGSVLVLAGAGTVFAARRRNA
jgi:LPXTG-motif cell wall-anchored protein